MSCISATNSTIAHQYMPTAKSNLAAPVQQAVPSQVKPMSTDSKGDNDGSKGKMLNTYA